MGSLIGHVVPGSVFLFLGIWWIYSTWLRYFICRHRRKPFYMSSSFPFHCCPAGFRLPIEAFIILFGTLLGIAIELGAGFHRSVYTKTEKTEWYFSEINLQHFTMYLMFFIAGIMQLLKHNKFPLPTHLEHIAGLLAFSGEAILFYFHVHARNPIDIQLHILLVLSLVAIVICGTCEIIIKPTSVYATLMRAYFTTLHGVWFYQIGFMLYSPFHEHYDYDKDPQQHRSAMMITYYFVLDMALMSLFSLVVARFAYSVSKRYEHTIKFDNYEQISLHSNDDDIEDNDEHDLTDNHTNGIQIEKDNNNNGNNDIDMKNPLLSNV